MKITSGILISAALALTACGKDPLAEKQLSNNCQTGVGVKADLTSGVESVTEADLQSFAINLLPCVGDPNPDIRDGVVYESLSYLLRNEKLSKSTKIELFNGLIGMLEDVEDEDGFLKPFAALNLSEVARADRIEAYLSAEQRQKLVETTAQYMTNISDYRGFDDHAGWRHAVAHTADIALQLTLNENISQQQLAKLRASIAHQISPQNGHVYIHGESERLARPILFMARRGVFLHEGWDNWFASIGEPAPFENWNAVYKSEAGLAKLHNTKAFVNAIYINASLSQSENVKALETGALNVLMKLP